MHDELKLLLKKYYEWEGETGESYREMYFSSQIFGQYEHRFRLRTALKLLALKETEKVLDLGCAEGYVTFRLAEKSPHVTGMDISDNKLKKTDEVGKMFKPVKLPDFVCADANERLPFNDNEFDAVLCLETLEHTISPEMVLKEISRILKPGGRAILSIPTWSQYSWIHVLRNKVNPQNLNRPVLLANQFEQPFEGHIWNFTLSGFLNQFREIPLAPRRIKGAISFDLPFFQQLRANKKLQNITVRIQSIGDRLMQYIPGNEKYSRYVIVEAFKREV